MMFETGRVQKIEQGKAFVAMTPNAACAHCHAGSICHAEGEAIIIEAADPLGVKVNQAVEVAISEDNMLKASFVVYGIPLIALMCGMFAGQYLGKRAGVENIYEIVGGFGCFGLSFLFVRFYNHLFQQHLNNQPVITKILP